MTSLLATRRRAEDFARLVEGSRRTHDPNVAPLLELVAMLRPAAVEPSDAFRTSLRERLLTVAADRPRSTGAAATSMPAARSAVRTPTRLRVAAVAASVAIASGMVGTAAAARGAQPGDLLYSVKRGLEQTQVAVTTNAESQGRQQLGQATTRLAEVERLAATRVRPGDADRIALSQATLNDFAGDARKGGNLLIEAYQSDDRAAPIRSLREFVAESTPRLQALDAGLPAQVDGALQDALATLERLDQRALEICPSCDSEARGVGDGVVSTRPDRTERSGPAEPTPSEGATTASARPSKPFPDSTNPGPRAPTPDRSGPTAGPRLPLPLPWPWPSEGKPKPEPTVDEPEPAPTSEAPLPLPLPLPLPTSLPLPLPLGLPLPASLPLVQRAEQPVVMSLPWLLPAGLPAPTSDRPRADQPAPDAPSPADQTSPRDTPEATPTGTPTPGKTLPKPLPTLSPDDEETTSPPSGGSIFDHLFGPLF